jgi:hypothetical protein
MLAPVSEASYGEQELTRLCLASLERYPAFVQELEEATGTVVGLRTAGTLVVGFDDDDVRALDALHAYRTGLGLAAERLPGRAARRREPALTPRVRGGLLVAGDHSVDGRALHAALLAAARAQRSGGLRYGSGGVGTPAHMAAAAMLKLTGADGTHIPYRGANQAALAVEQGEVDFAFAISNIALPRMQQGAIRVLLTTGARRMAILPDLPTLAEAVPGGPVITSGSSIVGPAGIPAPIAARLHAAVGRLVTEDAPLREALTREGGQITLAASPDAYAAAWTEQFVQLQRLVALSGVRAE